MKNYTEIMNTAEFRLIQPEDIPNLKRGTIIGHRSSEVNPEITAAFPIARVITQNDRIVISIVVARTPQGNNILDHFLYLPPKETFYNLAVYVNVDPILEDIDKPIITNEAKSGYVHIGDTNNFNLSVMEDESLSIEIVEKNDATKSVHKLTHKQAQSLYNYLSQYFD